MKRRKKRALSLDAEIRKAAKQIEATRMADAYKAAALGIVARKQDEILAKQNEITAILRAAGLQGVMGAVVAGAQPAMRAPQPAGPTCVTCGQPGVRRAKPNQWNRGNPPWYCATHQVLAGVQEVEDRIDNALIGAPAPVVKKEPVVMQTQAPAKMVPQVEVPETSPGDGLAEAFKALGVAQ